MTVGVSSLVPRSLKLSSRLALEPELHSWESKSLHDGLAGDVVPKGTGSISVRCVSTLSFV